MLDGFLGVLCRLCVFWNFLRLVNVDVLFWEAKIFNAFYTCLGYGDIFGYAGYFIFFLLNL